MLKIHVFLAINLQQTLIMKEQEQIVLSAIAPQNGSLQLLIMRRILNSIEITIPHVSPVTALIILKLILAIVAMSTQNQI
jgi:hypothetical protein